MRERGKAVRAVRVQGGVLEREEVHPLAAVV